MAAELVAELFTRGLATEIETSPETLYDHSAGMCSTSDVDRNLAAECTKRSGNAG